MPLQVRNLDWLRSLKGDTLPADAGARLHEMVKDIISGVNTLETQTNSNLHGTPAAPPAPDALKVVSHPQGVQFSITHNADFYKGATYRIDATAGKVTHTYDVGASRNGILPVGNLKASYQVRREFGWMSRIWTWPCSALVWLNAFWVQFSPELETFP